MKQPDATTKRLLVPSVIEDRYGLLASGKVKLQDNYLFLSPTNIMTCEEWEDNLSSRGINYVVVDMNCHSTERYAIFVEAKVLRAWNASSEGKKDKNEQLPF